jgi:hypothetical protein
VRVSKDRLGGNTAEGCNLDSRVQDRVCVEFS